MNARELCAAALGLDADGDPLYLCTLLAGHDGAHVAGQGPDRPPARTWNDGDPSAWWTTDYGDDADPTS